MRPSAANVATDASPQNQSHSDNPSHALNGHARDVAAAYQRCMLSGPPHQCREARRRLIERPGKSGGAHTRAARRGRSDELRRERETRQP